MSDDKTLALIANQHAEITRLTALLEEAGKVIEPFADIGGEGDEDFPDTTEATVKFGRTTHYALTLGHLRAARALSLSLKLKSHATNDGKG